MQYDLVVIGGGIVGLATALQTQRKMPHLRIAVIEKETQVASHQSSRNSGVIHSGIYYRPGSLRATNCKRGRAYMLDFCRQNEIPHDVCGKIIVATNPDELPRLEAIRQRGISNGLQGLRLLSPAETREIEPHVQALQSLWVPQAGIVDYGQVARRYATLLQEGGADVFTGEKIVAIEQNPEGLAIHSPSRSFQTRFMVNCAGLYADKIARMAGLDPGVQVLPFRGEYYELNPGSQHLVRNLVYPLPNLNFPFLGVHFTRMIGGGIEAGPNAVLAYRREGYHRSEWQASELWEILRYPGFHRIAAKYWRDGWKEFRRSYSKIAFVQALQTLVPEITETDVHVGRSGVRAMACTPNGEMLDDFLFVEHPRMIHVLNAPSPAATASLSIGETIAEKIVQRF